MEEPKSIYHLLDSEEFKCLSNDAYNKAEAYLLELIDEAEERGKRWALNKVNDMLDRISKNKS